jgi:hypothetical protein
VSAVSFERRDLSPALEAVRDEHAPGAIVLDSSTDFETLDPARAEELGLLVDAIDPLTYPPEWFPEDVPALLQRHAADSFTIGIPGDGSVTWTRQTTPPLVVVKPRIEGSPSSFVDFLVAEALVEVGLDVPESFPGFFEDSYRDLSAATDLSGAETYQLGAALFDAWVGLSAREAFSELEGELGDAWTDAGRRLEPRIDDLHAEVAHGDTSFPEAAELACSGIKHGVSLPAPFSALDNAAYRERGAPYAVTWAEKTFEKL